MSAPDAAALERLIGFGRALRGRGLPVGTGRIVTFCRSAGALGLRERDDLYWAGRASLISRPEDVETFDAAFDDWFGTGVHLDLSLPAPPGAGDIDDIEQALRDGPLDDHVVAREWHEADEGEEAEGDASIRIVASAAEMLREKSFADLTEEERERMNRMIRTLAIRLPTRHTRRYRPAPTGSRFEK